LLAAALWALNGALQQRFAVPADSVIAGSPVILVMVIMEWI